MGDEKPKARVFISCGQKSGAERQTAERIRQALEEIGFKTYVAVEQQRLEGFRENIFRNLEDSEYFVFVDFKRERLDDGPLCRGSLFCHQELAVSSYIAPDRDILAFHERGIKQPDGMMNALQVNSQEFTDSRHLPEVIAYRAKSHWDPHWKNQLRLETVEESFGGGTNPEIPKHFHIDVNNLHHQKTVRNCQAYLEEWVNVDTGECGPQHTIELKWAGYPLPSAAILPQRARRLDAFVMCETEPYWCKASSFADVAEFVWRIDGPGEFELTYVVYSYNFAPASIKCKLILADNWDDMSFKQISKT